MVMLTPGHKSKACIQECGVIHNVGTASQESLRGIMPIEIPGHVFQDCN